MGMNTANPVRVHPRIVGALCLCVLCIILVAGLWPFRAPRNQVIWLQGRNGLRFGHLGSVVSSGAFQPRNSNDATCSLEIWLAPDLAQGTPTILAFEGTGLAGPSFAMQQRRRALVIRRHNVDRLGTDRTAVTEVENAFGANQTVFVTVTLGPHETSVYLDGVLAITDPIAGVSANNFSGRLVLADSSTANDGWPGQIMGLAIYDRQLLPSQVAQHYESWSKNQRPTFGENEAPSALYLFDERTGATAHNRADPATDLTIPSRYFLLHPAFFLAPWREYRPTWEYWQDFGVNLGGFVPFGFCFAAYFSSVRRIRRPSATVIALGFLTSLTIETLQVFLPTRCSGTTDLMTNTLGTAMGVALYRGSFVQNLLIGPKRERPDSSPETSPEPVMVTSD